MGTWVTGGQCGDCRAWRGRPSGRKRHPPHSPSYSDPNIHYPSLWYGVYIPPSFIPTTLCLSFLVLIHPLLQLNISGETLYNRIVKFELPKVSNIKHLRSRLCVHLLTSPNSTAWNLAVDKVPAFRLASGWHFSKKASVLMSEVWISNWNVFFTDH